MTSAMNQVFAIAELVEAILVCIPSRKPSRPNQAPDYHYFPLQRVNHLFRDVINRPTGEIRERMLKGPKPETELSNVEYNIRIQDVCKHEEAGADVLNVCHSKETMPNVDRYLLYWTDLRTCTPGVADIAPKDKGFAESNATWQQLLLHPHVKVQVTFYQHFSLSSDSDDDEDAGKFM